MKNNYIRQVVAAYKVRRDKLAYYMLSMDAVLCRYYENHHKLFEYNHRRSNRLNRGIAQ